MVCGMPSSALGSRGIEGLGEALGAPALTLLARHNLQCATTMMARRMPFMTCEVTMMILSYDWMEDATSVVRSILRVTFM